MEGVPALRGTDHATLPDRSRPRASPPRRSPPTAMSRSPGPGRSTSSPFLHTLRRAGGEFAETPGRPGVLAGAGIDRGRRRDRGPPRPHDRLAAAADRPPHPGPRHVSCPRDHLRGPLRLHRAAPRDGRHHAVPGSYGMPLRQPGLPAHRQGDRGPPGWRAATSRYPTCAQGSATSSRPSSPAAPRSSAAPGTWNEATRIRSASSRQSARTLTGFPPEGPAHEFPGSRAAPARVSGAPSRACSNPVPRHPVRRPSRARTAPVWARP